MTKDLLISQLRLGQNGNSIMAILDVLCDGMGDSDPAEDAAPVTTKSKKKS